MDGFAHISDAELRLLQADQHIKLPQAPEPVEWWENYHYDNYDWDDRQWLRRNRGPLAWRPIPLSQGYFMAVLATNYKHMTQYPDGRPKRWIVKIDRNPLDGSIRAVYARRKGRKKYGEPTWVFAHRELLNVLEFPQIVGDHINGEGLDNRGTARRAVNLAKATKSQNGHNTFRSRPVHGGLPAGVEKRGKDSKGRQLYGGKVCVRLSRSKVKTIRSKDTWLKPSAAAKWYTDYLKRLHNRSRWVHKVSCVPKLDLPRRLEDPIEVPVQMAPVRGIEAHPQVATLAFKPPF